MTVDAHKNFAYSAVATAPSPATSGTSLVVTSGDGAKFPTPPFNATVWPTGANPTVANAEIVRVTAISTDTLTITRAQESSSARTVVAGDQIAATITAKTLTDIEAGLSSGGSGTEIGYDQTTANTTVTATSAPGTTCLTCAAHTFDGAAVWAEVNVTGLQPGVSVGANLRVYLTEGSTQIAAVAVVFTAAAANIIIGQYTRFKFTPSAGSHTYLLTCVASGGNGTFHSGTGTGGADAPSYVRFVKA